MEPGRFEVDTGHLRQSIGSLRQDLAAVKALCGELSDMMAALSGMWEGPAREAFHLRFSDDCAAFTQACGQLEEIIESMEHAAREYDACDSRVRSLIDALDLEGV